MPRSSLKLRKKKADIDRTQIPRQPPPRTNDALRCWLSVRVIDTTPLALAGAIVGWPCAIHTTVHARHVCGTPHPGPPNTFI